MAVLYDGYCYESLEEAARIAGSMPGYASSDSVIVPSGALNINTATNTADIVFKSYGISTNNFKSIQATQTFQTCSDVGYLHNNSGISLSDANEVTWSVVLIWLIAYYFRSLRPAVRGY